MKLVPGQRSILAYFSGSSEAQDAVNALKTAGFPEVQLDRVSRYGVSNNSERNNAIAGRAFTNTGLSLFSAEADSIFQDAHILLGADPSVEGYTPPDYGSAGGRAFLVTVVAPAEHIEKAVSILRTRNAYF